MFGTSGLRGEVGRDVTAALALSVGRAVASEGYHTVVVGRDVRDSGAMLADAVSAGIRECGADVIRLGVVSTPTVARSVGWLGADAGIAVTASHNPPSDNGLKLWNPSGRAFDRDQLATVARRVQEEAFDLASWRRIGVQTRRSGMATRHVQALTEGVVLADQLRVVVDVGNGTGGLTADALTELGCEVTTLHAQPDGRFPGRPSEPTADTCRTLRRTVAATNTDFGVAHDGDADRTMAVTSDGEFVPGDTLLALFASEHASDGDRVAAPINASLAVADEVTAVGGTLVRTRVGDGYVAERASEPDVVFGGEPSGAWIWPAETLAPDGPLAACQLAELVAERGSLDGLVASVASYPLRRDRVQVEDSDAVAERCRQLVCQSNESVDTTDGVRVADDDGWFLIRASGTEPLVRLTAEARTADRADELLTIARDYVTTAIEERSDDRHRDCSGRTESQPRRRGTK